MTTIAGGDDGTEKAARVLARRPTIRPRPVTPPRTAAATPAAPAAARVWTLPPVRLPSPRIHTRAQASTAMRPVLLLVADASDQFEIALRHDERAAAARRNWRGSRTIALATASLVVLAVAAGLVGWASARPSEQLQTSAVAARSASQTRATAMPTVLPAAKAAEPALPVIPLVDVKSLPPAPRRM
jgi:hypothetical protein